MADTVEEVDIFLRGPNLEAFEGLGKKHLIELGNRYELWLKNSMVKKELQRYVMTMLVADEMFAEKDVKDKFPELKRDPREIERSREREEKEKDREREREREEREREREAEKEKDRELEREKIELEKDKLRFEEAEKERQRQHEERMLFKEQEAKNSYVPGKYLVPHFNEDHVEEFFDSFEKVAKQAKWPENQWTLIIQAKLVGKAQLVYANLTASESEQYKVFKKEVLKAYELVPEAYRQEFRSIRKTDSQTHLEFAKEKTKVFDRWCKATKVHDFESLKQLILLEEFKWKIHEAIRCHLNEREINTLNEAAKIADDYALTHKKLLYSAQRTNQRSLHANSSFKSHSVSSGPPKQNKEFQGKKPTSGAKSSVKGEIICHYCKEAGHIVPTCPVLERKRKKEPQSQVIKPGGFVAITGSHSDGNLHSITRKPSLPTAGICRDVNNISSGDSLKSTMPYFDNSSSGDSLKSTMPYFENISSGDSLKSTMPYFEDGPLITAPCGDQNSDAAKFDGERPVQNPFELSGKVSIGGSQPVPIRIWRDTGALQTLLLASTFDAIPIPDTTNYVVCQGIGDGQVSVPLHEVYLESDLVKGVVTVGLTPSLPHHGISMLLGNDLAGGNVFPSVRLTSKPSLKKTLEEDLEIYPSCAVTRSMSQQKDDNHTRNVNLADTMFANLNDDEHMISLIDGVDMANTIVDPVIRDGTRDKTPLEKCSCSHQDLVQAQKQDQEIAELRMRALSDTDIETVPIGYYLQDDLLMRKYRPRDIPVSEDWAVTHQIVVPKLYRNEILSMAHDLPFGGHLGVRKTKDRILRHFFWPGMDHDVKTYCRSCHNCQIAGKHQSDPPSAPLHPIPAFHEPFSRVIIDCVGPLPKTKGGNQYLLTLMCASTRYPEAFPLRNIRTKTIKAVLLKFFTTFGLPEEVQSDRGTNFTSREFQNMLNCLNVKHVLSSAYHPESQGALERFHATLKTMIRTFCLDQPKSWDEGIPLLLFAAREVVQESLGFSPFELVFGHQVRGPLALLSEKWKNNNQSKSLLDHMQDFRQRLQEMWKLAKDNLTSSQHHMKVWYDRKARARVFKPGEKVLVLFPIQSNPLQARFHGPYLVQKQVGDLNYVVQTPDRRRSTQLCHVNMLKPYVDRNTSAEIGLVVPKQKVDSDQSEKVEDTTLTPSPKLSNSETLVRLDAKLGHLTPQQQEDLRDILWDHKTVFPDVPTITNAAVHDVDVGETQPIKQHAYRVSPDKQELIDQEISYMLQHNIIRESESSWSSPCVLVPKANGTVRFCTDYRKLNTVTRTDVYPIPRVDDCIDRIGNAQYVTKIDLLKGYWGVPLSERAREVSAFVTHAGLYEYNVMPFGMKNAPATFQRMMEKVLQGLTYSYAYIDDVVIRSDSWTDHCQHVRVVLGRLRDANLTVNLAKSEFGCATVTYLGFEIGQGKLAPIDAKVRAITDFPPPKDLKGLRRFLGMIGYYRKFCQNFAQLASPLTNLLKKEKKFEWSDNCAQAFEKLKQVLCHCPVLKLPDFKQCFELSIDASDLAAGAVLTQAANNNEGLQHPIAYFSKKFNPHQRNYSTIEKELLALIMAIQHFEVYINVTRMLTVHTDHNPLVFLSKMKNKNRRLLQWSLLLQEYNLDIKHVRGKDNIIADTLSRC